MAWNKGTLNKLAGSEGKEMRLMCKSSLDTLASSLFLVRGGLVNFLAVDHHAPLLECGEVPHETCSNGCRLPHIRILASLNKYSISNWSSIYTNSENLLWVTFTPLLVSSPLIIVTAPLGNN